MEELRIWCRQIDKVTGETIGKLRSVMTYPNIKSALRDFDIFEVETETFKQEVVAVSKENPFATN